MSLGENIKRLRLKRNMTQGELGEQVGLSRSQISNIEKGVRSTSTGGLTKIANILGVSVGDLYDEKVTIEDGYAVLTDELKREGIDPETARKWIQLAKQFAKDDK